VTTHNNNNSNSNRDPANQRDAAVVSRRHGNVMTSQNVAHRAAADERFKGGFAKLCSARDRWLAR